MRTLSKIMLLFLVLSLFALSATLVHSDEKLAYGSELSFYIKDWRTNQVISNLPVKFQIIDMASKKITSVLRYPKDGQIKYSLNEGNYTISVELSNNSQATDFYGIKEVIISSQEKVIEEIYVYPVGSL